MINDMELVIEGFLRTWMKENVADSAPENDEDWLEGQLHHCLEYIHYNPVKKAWDICWVNVLAWEENKEKVAAMEAELKDLVKEMQERAEGFLQTEVVRGRSRLERDQIPSHELELTNKWHTIACGMAKEHLTHFLGMRLYRGRACRILSATEFGRFTELTGLNFPGA